VHTRLDLSCAANEQQLIPLVLQNHDERCRYTPNQQRHALKHEEELKTEVVVEHPPCVHRIAHAYQRNGEHHHHNFLSNRPPFFGKGFGKEEGWHGDEKCHAECSDESVAGNDERAVGEGGA